MPKKPHKPHPITWRNRPGWILTNGIIDAVVLTGGGHIADVRFRPETGLPTVNVLWEAPWKLIDPGNFQSQDARRYGPPYVGKFLSGFTGHVLCLDYFGAPSDEEIKQGLSLHGEAPVSRWTVSAEGYDSLATSLDLPNAGLKFSRRITAVQNESVLYFQETVQNQRTTDRFFSWVQHATFGDPLLTPEESSFFVCGSKSATWKYGYEGKAILRDGSEFAWPKAPRSRSGQLDLRRPFSNDGTGFVASVLVDERRDLGTFAVLNWRLGLAAGYVFRRRDFPWVTLWEENRARAGVPWNGRVRARGVEFGTTPFPIGLRATIAQGPMFDNPTIATVGAKAQKTTSYAMFLMAVPRSWREIQDVVIKQNSITLVGSQKGQKLAVAADKLQSVLS